MACLVIVIGRSGTGKSTSLRKFKPGEVGIVNVLGKPLPFRNQLPSVQTTNYAYVKRVIAQSKARSIVVDDAGYLITDMFMKGHANVGRGNDVYEFYNQLGDSFYSLLRFIGEFPDRNKVVYVVMHEDADDFGNAKIKTIGKMLDEKVCIEGITPLLLRSHYNEGQYLFNVNGDGIWKSPIGMFEGETIDNDLVFVDDTLREYWYLEPRVNTGVMTR